MNNENALIIKDCSSPEKYTSFFEEYDYIVGDIAYSKLRLKGFNKKDNKNFNKINDYQNVEKYIKENGMLLKGYIDDYWFAELDIEHNSIGFQRFQSKKLDLSEFQQ